MAVPKNVQKNNRVRAFILDCNEVLEGRHPEVADFFFHDFAADINDFLRQHQNTCAIYEAVCIYKLGGGIGYSYSLFCPYCMKCMQAYGD